MINFEEWEGFEGRIWKEEVNVRDFIQKNYTPYDGDESFLADPTEATNKLWGTLRAAKLVQGPCDAVKLLGNGTLTKNLNVVVDFVSASAREKVTRAGGTVTVLSEA